VRVECAGAAVDGRSFMSMLMLDHIYDSPMTITCHGRDAEDALETIRRWAEDDLPKDSVPKPGPHR
jgi:phosphotransferase system HPr-like phosphotransfer protein